MAVLEQSNDIPVLCIHFLENVLFEWAIILHSQLNCFEVLVFSQKKKRPYKW